MNDGQHGSGFDARFSEGVFAEYETFHITTDDESYEGSSEFEIFIVTDPYDF